MGRMLIFHDKLNNLFCRELPTTSWRFFPKLPNDLKFVKKGSKFSRSTISLQNLPIKPLKYYLKCLYKNFFKNCDHTIWSKFLQKKVFLNPAECILSYRQFDEIALGALSVLSVFSSDLWPEQALLTKWTAFPYSKRQILQSLIVIHLCNKAGDSGGMVCSKYELTPS